MPKWQKIRKSYFTRKTMKPFNFQVSKDEFKIEPRYAHKKNLDKSEKNHMEGQNWLMKTILQLKSIKKQKIFKFQCSMMIHFQDMIFFSGLSKFFLCAYRGSILNSSLAKKWGFVESYQKKRMAYIDSRHRLNLLRVNWWPRRVLFGK